MRSQSAWAKIQGEKSRTKEKLNILVVETQGQRQKPEERKPQKSKNIYLLIFSKMEYLLVNIKIPFESNNL